MGDLALTIYLSIFVYKFKNEYMKQIFRELSKLCMFTIIIGFPLWLSYWNRNNNYLWLFILSLVLLFMIFNHYEDLEQIDNFYEKMEDEEDGE